MKSMKLAILLVISLSGVLSFKRPGKPAKSDKHKNFADVPPHRVFSNDTLDAEGSEFS